MKKFLKKRKNFRVGEKFRKNSGKKFGAYKKWKINLTLKKIQEKFLISKKNEKKFWASEKVLNLKKKFLKILNLSQKKLENTLTPF